MSTSWMQTSGRAAPANQRTCAHCHQPLLVEAISPRWRGYCTLCAGRLAGHPHLESA